MVGSIGRRREPDRWGTAMVGTPRAISLSDSAYLADPYPTYAGLRAEAPVHAVEHVGWLVSRHADISALLHDRRLKSAPMNEALYGSLPDEALAEVVPFRESMNHNLLF